MKTDKRLTAIGRVVPDIIRGTSTTSTIITRRTLRLHINELNILPNIANKPITLGIRMQIIQQKRLLIIQLLLDPRPNPNPIQKITRQKPLPIRHITRFLSIARRLRLNVFGGSEGQSVQVEGLGGDVQEADGHLG